MGIFGGTGFQFLETFQDRIIVTIVTPFMITEPYSLLRLIHFLLYRFNSEKELYLMPDKVWA